MIWRISCASLILTAFTLLTQAQLQEPIYVPFAWNKVPATATPIRTSGPTTTFVLLENSGRRLAPGPATLIQQNPSQASMTYIAAPTETLSGVCNLRSPIAVCTLNVYVTGAPFPSTGLQGKSAATAIGGGGGRSAGTAQQGSAPAGMGGFIFALGVGLLGFAISVALVR